MKMRTLDGEMVAGATASIELQDLDALLRCCCLVQEPNKHWDWFWAWATTQSTVALWTRSRTW